MVIKIKKFEFWKLTILSFEVIKDELKIKAFKVELFKNLKSEA